MSHVPMITVNHVILMEEKKYVMPVMKDIIFLIICVKENVLIKIVWSDSVHKTKTIVVNAKMDMIQSTENVSKVSFKTN